MNLFFLSLYMCECFTCLNVSVCVRISTDQPNPYRPHPHPHPTPHTQYNTRNPTQLRHTCHIIRLPYPPPTTPTTSQLQRVGAVGGADLAPPSVTPAGSTPMAAGELRRGAAAADGTLSCDIWCMCVCIVRGWIDLCVYLYAFVRGSTPPMAAGDI